MRWQLNAKAYILRNPSVRAQPAVWSAQGSCKFCPGPQWPVGSGLSALKTGMPARPWAVWGQCESRESQGWKLSGMGSEKKLVVLGVGTGDCGVNRMSRSPTTSVFTFQDRDSAAVTVRLRNEHSERRTFAFWSLLFSVWYCSSGLTGVALWHLSAARLSSGWHQKKILL